DSFKYNAVLKNTAAYTTDRSILFEFITSKSFYQNKIAENISRQISEIYNIEVLSEEVKINSNEKIISEINKEEKKINTDDANPVELKNTESEIKTDKTEEIVLVKEEDENENTTETSTSTDTIKTDVLPVTKDLPKQDFDFDNVDSKSVMDPHLFHP